MKKLYIGLGVSAALIIGGFSYSAYAKPTVDMTKMGKYYYQLDMFRNRSNEGYEAKVLSADKFNIKVQIKFKDFSGQEELSSVVGSSINDENTDKKIVGIIDEYFSNDPKVVAKNLNIPWKEGDNFAYWKKETVNYKWIEKPRNLVLSDKRYENPKKKKYKGMLYMIQKPILDNGKIPESGTKVISAKESGETSFKINGINGSGVLELEFKSVYNK